MLVPPNDLDPADGNRQKVVAQNYKWTPSDQTVYNSSTGPGQLIPPGFVRQTARGRPSVSPIIRPLDIHAVYAAPVGDRNSVVRWWADTWRRDSIQRVLTDNNFPAYHFELAQSDGTTQK